MRCSLLRWANAVVGVGFGWESAALITGWLPPLTRLSIRYRWMKPILLAGACWVCLVHRVHPARAAALLIILHGHLYPPYWINGAKP